MSRDVLLSSNNREFLLTALRGVDNGSGQTVQMRLDGRTPNDRRTVTIKTGIRQTAAAASSAAAAKAAGRAGGADNSGIVEVALGQTKAMASVTGEVVKPSPSRPAEGFVNFFVSLSPLASPSLSAAASLTSQPSDRCVEIVRLLERSIRESWTVDTEALCLVAAEKVWSLRVDVVVLDDAGNLTDVASLAALAALLGYRRPDVTVLGEELRLHAMDERQPLQLRLRHLPLCVSFALFEDGELFVCDPTAEEEAASCAAVSVVVDEHHELCGLYKHGGQALSVERLLQLLAVADARAQEVLEKVKEKLGGAREEGRGAVAVQQHKRLPGGGGLEAAELFGVALSRTERAVSSEAELRERGMDTIDLSAERAKLEDDEDEDAQAAAERKTADAAMIDPTAKQKVSRA